MQRPIQFRSLEELPVAARTAARALRAGVVDMFGQDLHALYLHGAVTFPSAQAADGAEGAESTEGAGNLDYHAILARPPSPARRTALATALAVHEAEMARRHPRYAAHLDGWVIGLDAARRPAPPAHLLQPELRDHAWALHRAHWLAVQCVVLHGPGPAEIVPVPTGGELRAALNFALDFAARDHSDADAVLNACRIIRSAAQDNVVQSKLGSALWALDQLPPEHGPAIRAAMASYRGHPTAPEEQALASGRAALITLAARSLGR